MYPDNKLEDPISVTSPTQLAVLLYDIIKVGVIDAGYRGEVTAKFKRLHATNYSEYMIYERFAQLVVLPIPNIEFEEVDELSDSERGTGGYGSSGL